MPLRIEPLEMRQRAVHAARATGPAEHPVDELIGEVDAEIEHALQPGPVAEIEDERGARIAERHDELAERRLFHAAHQHVGGEAETRGDQRLRRHREAGVDVGEGAPTVLRDPVRAEKVVRHRLDRGFDGRSARAAQDRIDVGLVDEVGHGAYWITNCGR